MSDASPIAARVRALIAEESHRASNATRFKEQSSPAWKALRDVGTRLWVDSGDIQEISEIWTSEFEALTTNNTLLNKEIQKGLYDELIGKTANVLRAVDPQIAEQQLLLEIAFVLNAHHGLRLVDTFDAHVSVELHTDLAGDIENTVMYGRRYFEICPERFYVKVPFTPAGLIGARKLGEAGVPINFTLGYSARQNYLAALLARPAYLNVFMGRLNSFVADNKLGDGEHVGEKATLATQRELARLREAGRAHSKLIGASIRSGDQVAAVAGTDVLTIPTKAAAQYAGKPDRARPVSHVKDELPVSLADGVRLNDFGGAALWTVDEPFKQAVDALLAGPVDALTPAALEAHFASAGMGDLLPSWTPDELKAITRDGKIPSYARWKGQLFSGAVGLDALMNISGLCAFMVDQKALDDRVRSLI